MTSLDDVRAVVAAMRGYPRPWWFAGGWAIDLFVGRVSREHHDVEIGAWRGDQAVLHAHLAGYGRRKVVDGQWSEWRAGERVELPAFQLRAAGPAGAFDLFLDESADGGDRWVFRRDPTVTLPTSRLVVRSEIGGLPALAPEVQLLYKAKYHRPQDEADFNLVVGRLGEERRGWLREALRVHRPGDAWVGRLGE